MAAGVRAVVSDLGRERTRAEIEAARHDSWESPPVIKIAYGSGRLLVRWRGRRRLL
jgi:hypothetical protein